MRRKKEASYRSNKSERLFEDGCVPRSRSIFDKEALDPWGTPTDGLPARYVKRPDNSRHKKKFRRGGKREVHFE